MAQSPAPSHSGEIIQHGFHHLIQHNASNNYPIDPYEQDERRQSRSHYSTPGPELYGPPIYGYQSQQNAVGMGNPYGGVYKSEYSAQMYNDRYSTPATSPPTPQAEVLRTRSGLMINKAPIILKSLPEVRARIEKQAPKRIKKEKMKAEKRVAKLDRPLSELTKDWKHVPVVDIEAYVNRSAEERCREVEEGKVPGKVKRPMNSFMLYRKAYQNRTKDWCLQNNHQIVSQVCGDSWPLEPEEVREQFTEWARIERINHQNAHPGYKFSPSKPGAAKAAKRKVSEEPMSAEESDLEDYDWQRSQRRKKARASPKVERSVKPKIERPVAYPSTRSAYKYVSRENSIEPGGYYRSSWQQNNPGRPMPMPYNSSDLRPGQYYQQHAMPSQGIPGSQDVIIKKTEESQYGYGYLGLPGCQEYDNMMNPYGPYKGVQNQDYGIDPALMSQEQGAYDRVHYAQPQTEGVYLGDVQPNNEQWDASYGMIDPGLSAPGQYLADGNNSEQLEIHDLQMHVLKGENEGWQVEALDAGSEFDKWMGEDRKVE